MTAEQDIATVREGIRYGEYDCRLLSGRDFDSTYWAGKDAALDRLAEVLDHADKALRAIASEPPSHLRDGVDVRVLDALALLRGTP